MIDGFYEKIRIRIEKTLSKENKRSILLCKELLDELSLHPRQELYDISRLNDEMFHVMNKLNNAIGDFVRSLDVVREKVGKDLSLQKERTVLKEEK